MKKELWRSTITTHEVASVGLNCENKIKHVTATEIFNLLRLSNAEQHESYFYFGPVSRGSSWLNDL